MATSNKHFRKREAILACLRNTDAHPSAEMVFSQLRQDFPDISLGTVYRNLSMFKNQGMIASLGTVGGIERFDGNTKPHVHFICTCCNAVMDLPDLQVPQELYTSVNTQTGGSVDGCQLTFTGICSKCMAGRSSQTA